MAATKKGTKKATKAATKKATPRKATGKKKPAATQLQVVMEAREFLAKKHGADLVESMEEIDSAIPGWISTQSLAIDRILGGRGCPQSRLIEVSGLEADGKSTLLDHVMAEVQRIGGVCYLWDTENARMPGYMDKLGVQRKRATVIRAETIEQGVPMIQSILDWHLEHSPDLPGVIGWDTVAGTPTEAELSDDPKVKSERYGPAKMLRGMFRKLNQTLRRTRFLIFAVNQSYLSHDNSNRAVRKTYGGDAIPYFASQRLEFLGTYKSKQWLTEEHKKLGYPPLGHFVPVQILKNKTGSPARSTRIFVRYGHGICNVWTVFDVLSQAGLISQAGGWYTAEWPGIEGRIPKWQGGSFHGLRDLIAADPEIWPILLEAYNAMGDPYAPA